MPALARDAGILGAVFAAVSAIAYALGAANLGTALTFGQLAFVVALVLVVVRS
jgi:hypothetical protein